MDGRTSERWMDGWMDRWIDMCVKIGNKICKFRRGRPSKHIFVQLTKIKAYLDI